MFAGVKEVKWARSWEWITSHRDTIDTTQEEIGGKVR